MRMPLDASAAVAPCQIHPHHDHTHGDGCGHKTITHGSHVDYLHEGHRHRVHGDHVDECISHPATKATQDHAP